MEPARGTGWNINRKLEIDSISSNIQSLVMEFGYRMTDGHGKGSLLSFLGSVQSTPERSASNQYHNKKLRKTLIQNIQALNSFEELNPRILRKGFSLVNHVDSFLKRSEAMFSSHRNNPEDPGTPQVNEYSPPSYSISNAEFQAGKSKRGRPRKHAPKEDMNTTTTTFILKFLFFQHLTV